MAPAEVVTDRIDRAGASYDIAVVVGIVAALSLPHLIMGPDLTADDWVWVRNGEFLGWWDAGGTRQVGRPGAFVLYAVTFGLGGPHPLVHAVIQVLLWMVAGVAVLVALREVVSRGVALTTTSLWLAAPSHLSMELWASTSQAWVAVALLAFGCRSVARWSRGEASIAPALLLIGAAGAFYEVAIVAAPLAAWLVRRRATGRWDPVFAIWAALSVVPSLAWAIGSATVYSDDVSTTEAEWLRHLAGPLGMGVKVHDQRVAAAVVLVFVLALVRPVRRTLSGEAVAPWDALALSGAALAVCGVLPALRSYTIPVGMGDRLTAVSGLGAAIAWVGILGPLVAWASPRSKRLMVALLVAVALIGRLDMLGRWTAVGDDAAREATVLADKASEAPDGMVIVDGPLVVRGDVYGLFDGWSATAAAQVRSGRDDLVVRVDVGCIRSGPRPSDPLEQDGGRPEDRSPRCEDA